MAKSTSKNVRYSEPLDYFPKEIRDSVFGTGSKSATKKSTTTKATAKKSTTSTKAKSSKK